RGLLRGRGVCRHHGICAGCDVFKRVPDGPPECAIRLRGVSSLALSDIDRRSHRSDRTISTVAASAFTRGANRYCKGCCASPARVSKTRDDLGKEIDQLRGQLQVYPDLVNNVNFWAHDTGQAVDSFVRFVSNQRSLRLDGERAAAARIDLIDKMEGLSQALWVINWDVYIGDKDSPAEERQA